MLAAPSGGEVAAGSWPTRGDAPRARAAALAASARARCCSSALRCSASGSGGVAGCLRRGRGGGAVATLLGERTALVHGLGDDARHEVGRADRVVVAGDDEIDDVGIAVRVDHRDHGDAETVRLGDRDVLLLGVDHEDRVRQTLEVADAAEIALELRELPRDLERLLLRHLLGLAGLHEALQLAQLGDTRVDGLEVGERPTEPAVVDVRHAARGGLLLDRLLGLLLGAHEQHRAAVGHRAADEPVGGVDPFQGLLQVDDVDAVALAEDEPFHLRVPTARLVAEMDAGLQQLLHGDDSHEKSPRL